MKSKTAVYEMRRDGWLDYFELHVSPTAQAMQQHARATFEKYGFQKEEFRDTLGLVHPVQSPDGIFAFCFLNEQDLGAGVVAHECLHVAMAHERYILHFGMNYGDGFEDLADEERLAHFLMS